VLVFPAPVTVELGAKKGLVFPAPVTVEFGANEGLAFQVLLLLEQEILTLP
jgi:hypothetical protein